MLINFMTPCVGVLVLRCGHISYVVKIYYFFKNLLIYSKAHIRQTEGIVMMSKRGSTKIVNLPGVVVQGRGRIVNFFSSRLH